AAEAMGAAESSVAGWAAGWGGSSAQVKAIAEAAASAASTYEDCFMVFSIEVTPLRPQFARRMRNLTLSARRRQIGSHRSYIRVDPRTADCAKWTVSPAFCGRRNEQG